MDISDLQTFRAVVEHGGVSAAARQLHRVQSSISARLSGLERSLGCALFERRGKRLAPTPAGRPLYARTEEAVRGVGRRRGGAHDRASVAAGLWGPTAQSTATLPNTGWF